MILNFFQRVMELKTIPRQGWKNKLGLNDVESVAEHTYSTAILSMIFSDLHGFDTEKIIKMALIHDLAESVIGDLTPNQIPKNKKNKLENAAMTQILKNLPKKYQMIIIIFGMNIKKNPQMNPYYYMKLIN